MHPDETPRANTKVKIKSEAYKNQDKTITIMAMTYTADENGHVIFKQTFGSDVTSVSLTVRE